MPNCPECDRFHPQGSSKCPNCGTQLDLTISRSDIATIDIPLPPQITLTEPVTALSNQGLVADFGTDSLQFPIANRVYLGRDIPPKEYTSFIDLDPFGALTKGVSRLHALIERTEDFAYQVMDLGSTNGTFVNGEQLVPLNYTVLEQDDKVVLGHFSIIVRYDA